MHLILTGATGLVGSSVLVHILSLPPTTNITRLSILSRSPVPLAQTATRNNTTTEIEVINHTDYSNYPPELLSRLKGANGVIWAQGISQNDVPKDKYVEITKDYPLAAAKAFSSLNDRINFVYVSGEGATTAPPGYFTALFARVKGETETALTQLGETTDYGKTLRPYMARPAGVDGSMQPEVWKPIMERRTMSFRLMATFLLPPMRLFYQNMISPTPELGKALTDIAICNGEPYPAGVGIENNGRTLRNTALRQMAGLSVGWVPLSG